MNRSRYYWLDIARGICILLMVICHACGCSNGRWGAFNGVTGVFFLVIFFVSSGFCFDEKRSKLEYIKNQFKKCILPYFVVSSVYLIVQLYRHAMPGEMKVNKIMNAVASLLWGLSNTFNIGSVTTIGMGPLWFLVVFFMSTCLYKLIKDDQGVKSTFL